MKIIALHTSDETLIKKALRNDSKAEQSLFNRHAPKMLGVCRSYIKDLHYAEDVMIQGFTKAFENLDKFRHEGSFEGWLRRIMIREAVDFLRSRRQLYFSDIEEAETVPIPAESDYDIEILQWLMDNLPNGYKTVMILYSVEGYSHKEIAKMLDITESTSKSQLFKARKMLQQQLATLSRKENG
ncbi:RNA polymerase sigma factor [Flavobacterium zepuense]|uniref:RNA polymerase sigma factor n=1 Tax=Flavobacterium zepuense TaxID=2593302 RepID=A0A552UVW1_9FLAO|nr:RNA polymerase sigma factor [Flavobacterium zepuense]TRW22356.1 RNA polymerase sigma factor [Flavobacterium zepuense]